MTKDEALKLALEALENLPALNWIPEKDMQVQKAITAIREALAQPEHGPIACIGTNGELMWLNKPKVVYSKPIPLYTTPPQRKPLTDEEIDSLRSGYQSGRIGSFVGLCRAIEAAHGITGEQHG